MHILVFNAGSSSLKFGVFRLDAEDGAMEVFKGSYERFRDGRSEFRFRHGDTDERGTADIGDIDRAIEAIPAVLDRFGLTEIGAIGHRVVHGGARFSAATILDDATVAEIERRLAAHGVYVREHGEDMPEILDWQWSAA